MLNKLFHLLQEKPFYFAAMIFATITVGGAVEIIPSFMENSRPIEGTKPYSALEIAGRQVYIREGCNTCHSQLIRPFISETDRYGDYSKSGEYAYDRPFLWGSKRTGPDLMRVGNFRTTSWHEVHFKDAQSVSPGTAMPNFKWLFTDAADMETAYAELMTVKTIFKAPYDTPGNPSTGTLEEVVAAAVKEADVVVNSMDDKDVKEAHKNGEIREVVAVIAYLNSLR